MNVPLCLYSNHNIHGRGLAVVKNPEIRTHVRTSKITKYALQIFIKKKKKCNIYKEKKKRFLIPYFIIKRINL